MSNNYVSIRVSTLRGDQKIDFDAYIKIDEKWILYLRKGDSFENDRLKRLKNKKLKKLFIKDDHESLYQKYLERNIESAYDNTNQKTIIDRAEIIQGAQQTLTEELFENINSSEFYQKSKASTARFVDFILKNKDAATAITSIVNSGSSLSHHGVNVSTFSVTLARELEQMNEKDLTLLALGGLLHDFGHIDCKYNLNQPLVNLSKEDLALYNNHATLGAEKIKDSHHIDSKVIQIIYQHEEKLDGSGPLKMTKIDPMALIVSCANSFDRLISFEGLEKAEALKALKINGIGKYPLEMINKLVHIN